MDQHAADRAVWQKLPIDVAAAGTAAAAISPIVVLIDRAHSSPYHGTYTTANVLDTVAEASLLGDGRTAAAAKFGAVTTVSTGLTIHKDARMAQYFGSSRMRKVPLMTYSLFALRDAMTIYASFILPGVIAARVHTSPSLDRISQEIGIATESSIRKTAQFALPAMAQFLTTPVHLLGLSYFNQPTGTALSTRFYRVSKDLSLAIPIRMMRIIPAFGIGGVINSSTRQTLNEKGWLTSAKGNTFGT